LGVYGEEYFEEVLGAVAFGEEDFEDQAEGV